MPRGRTLPQPPPTTPEERARRPQVVVALSAAPTSAWVSWITDGRRRQGLDPGTRYFYRCGDPSIPDAMGDVHAFRTMPAVGQRSYPERIDVVGDLGLTYKPTSTVEHMVRNQPDLVLLLGDVCYANLYLTSGTGTDCYSCSFANSTPIH